MKKLIVLLIFCIFLCCTGCGKNTTENTIKFSSWGSQSELVILKSLIKTFEKENPDIKVEFIHIPQNYFQKLHLLFASKLEPDVIFLNNIYAPIYMKAGLLEDLSPYIKSDLEKQTFFKTATDGFTQGDKIYAIPRDVSNLVIYYNKDLFKKTNTPLPTENWTFDDFIKTARSLKTEQTFGINFENSSLFWIYYLESNGGGILSDDSKKIIIDSPQSINTLQLYSNLINKENIIPTKSQKASKTSAQMFIDGEIGMYLSGRWMVPKFRETIPFDWDVVSFPANEKNKVLVDSSGWAIAKNSKNKQSAIKLINFLSSKESIEKITESGLIIPARVDVAYSESFLCEEKKPKNSIVFIQMLKNAKPTPTNPNYQRINDILNEQLEPVFNGQEKAKSAINKKLTKDLSKLL